VPSPRCGRVHAAAAGEGDAVADGEHHHVHAVVREERVVQGDDRVVTLVGRVEHPTVAQHVVEDDESAGTYPGHDLLEVRRVAGLVGVDEREVQEGLGGQRAQGLDGRRDPQLDAVGDPGPLPVAPRDRRPLLAHVAGEQVPVVGQAAGDADRGVAGERADLHRLPGTDQAHQQSEELALVVRDLHAGAVAELAVGLRGEVAEHLVGGL
jgi:hypothetical protein